MAWPQRFRSLDDIPLSDADREWLPSVDEAAATNLCQILTTHRDELESITGGDPAMEKMLGNILVKVSTSTANIHKYALTEYWVPS